MTSVAEFVRLQFELSRVRLRWELISRLFLSTMAVLSPTTPETWTQSRRQFCQIGVSAEIHRVSRLKRP